ncbi:aldehyde ferredoxin oxidoreductase C-terminal domain-containing protein, partial [Escherichia coli]
GEKRVFLVILFTSFSGSLVSRIPGAVQHASLTMFYKEMGWDPQLGCPTRETLQRLGLEDIAADLAAHNLLPA